MKKYRVLIVDDIHPVLVEKFENAGYECSYLPNISLAEAEEIIHDYSGLIIRSKFVVDREFLNKAKKLEFIGRAGSGLENIDTETAKRQKIQCFNSPEGNRDAVAEQAIGMLLSLLNNLVRANSEVKNGIWQREKNRGTELAVKTIGIIGHGNVGSALAKKLQGFNLETLAYDKYKSGFGNEFVKEVEMAEIFEKADILTFHVPLTSETKYLFSENYLKNFQKNIILINTSRGEVVKTSDLVLGLKSGKISGACLDVLEYEKKTFEEVINNSLDTNFEYLSKAENVILSPHVAGWTHESYFKLADILVEKILKSF